MGVIPTEVVASQSEATTQWRDPLFSFPYPED